jgi:hypothetical protein
MVEGGRWEAKTHREREGEREKRKLDLKMLMQ